MFWGVCERVKDALGIVERGERGGREGETELCRLDVGELSAGIL
jgi:hypothetical protein